MKAKINKSYKRPLQSNLGVSALEEAEYYFKVYKKESV